MSILFDGLSLGAIYTLIALGYTMVYGIAKMLNFAHGDIIMVGAYAVFVTLKGQGHIALAIGLSAIICVIMGVLVEKFAISPFEALRLLPFLLRLSVSAIFYRV